ncbi:MAG TPA: hypothetical protein VEA38_23190 [Terriglobales bacterium]|nr:hypothetical protein [Terriglobales bacterium]
MSRAALALALLLVAGCAWPAREATRALADADARAAQGDYPAALAAYDAFLSRYPDDDGAVRARALRTVMNELLAVRAERDRLVREVATRESELARQVTARDAELSKLRQELATRQAEAARLREDLEALKRTDLQMERRRR